MDAELSRPDWLATVQSGRKQVQSRVCTPSFRCATVSEPMLLKYSLKSLADKSAGILSNCFRPVKPTVHYTTFVGRMANGRLNTRNRIVYAYRQQTLAVGTTVLNVSRPDSKNESGRLELR